MATLFLTYDLETKRFIGGSIMGKCFCISSAVLRDGSASVLDFEGKDILGGGGPASPPSDQAKVQADIAAAFGCGEQS